jgi:perosamine synthetase
LQVLQLRKKTDAAYCLARAKDGCMKHGASVKSFEEEFAAYVGAAHAVAFCNGTTTIQAALVALGVKPGDSVSVPPLTMAATSIAVLNVGAVPKFVDVEPDTWVMQRARGFQVPVSLYGLNCGNYVYDQPMVDDAAQRLGDHPGAAAFCSWSFQSSKILSTGEGGMLTTNDAELAARARSYASLGYRMRHDQPRINSDEIKSPDHARHYSLGINARMNDITAQMGLGQLRNAVHFKASRVTAATLYANAIEGCEWMRQQGVPEGCSHDFWTFAVALKDKNLFRPFTDAVVRFGGERAYGAWRLTFDEPAFARFRQMARLEFDDLTGKISSHPQCPIAKDLQPRLVQFQTNDLASAERNAKAVRKAIEYVDRLLSVTSYESKLMQGTISGMPCE